MKQWISWQKKSSFELIFHGIFSSFTNEDNLFAFSTQEVLVYLYTFYNKNIVTESNICGYSQSINLNFQDRPQLLLFFFSFPHHSFSKFNSFKSISNNFFHLQSLHETITAHKKKMLNLIGIEYKYIIRCIMLWMLMVYTIFSFSSI